LLRRFSNPEINDYGQRRAVVQSHQDVGRFDVAVNDAFLMSVLDSVANLLEELQPLGRGQVVLVAVIRDAYSTDQVHNEKRAAGYSCTRIKHARDIAMVHHGQGLTLSFKARDDLFRIHPGLDDLKGNSAPDRFLLLSHVNHPAPPFANLL
jgi:hypothetical protein